MKNLIYYPTFEPTNIIWLKYSLIYIDSFSPIIPQTGKSELSDTFRKISDNTKLVKSLPPTYNQADNAVIKALREISYIENDPFLYQSKFNHVNILTVWKNERNWTNKLYEEKFTMPLLQLCVHKGFGKRCPGGLLTSNEFAAFYMTFLAEEIAFDNQGSPITDNPTLDNFSTYLRAKDVTTEDKLSAAQTIVNVSIPRNINEISIDRFIEFRNESGMSELRNSFNSSVSLFYDNLENEFDEYAFLKTLEKTNQDLSKEIGLFFGGAASVVLGGLILLKNPLALDSIKQAIDGTIFSVAGITSINQAWALDGSRRKARKFVNKLNSL